MLLYGGAGRRFGGEKGLALFEGRPLVERLLAMLDSISDDVMISTNAPEAYRSCGHRLVPDLRPGWGPLAGIQSGLQAARYDWMAVVAGDMPFASAELLRLLAERAAACAPDRAAVRPAERAETCAVIVPLHTRARGREPDRPTDAPGAGAPGAAHPQPEPLHALYHRRCLTAIEAVLRAGGRRIVEIYPLVGVCEVAEGTWRAAGINDRVFANINTPEDLRRLSSE
ncbi:MAG: molybdenum cofactor guanylyltransferase [Candidatus Eisenbacteria bacterium]